MDVLALYGSGDLSMREVCGPRGGARRHGLFALTAVQSMKSLAKCVAANAWAHAPQAFLLLVCRAIHPKMPPDREALSDAGGKLIPVPQRRAGRDRALGQCDHHPASAQAHVRADINRSRRTHHRPGPRPHANAGGAHQRWRSRFEPARSQTNAPSCVTTYASISQRTAAAWSTFSTPRLSTLSWQPS